MATTTTAKAATPQVLQGVQARKRKLPAWLSALLHNPLSITGALIVLGFVVIAVLAPVLAPTPVGAGGIAGDPYTIPRDGFGAQPKAPSATHPFGTSEGQYDIYYGVIWGTRTAFKVGIIIMGLTVLIGGLVGAVSGFIGGWFD